ncbi:MAG: hypothetical protein AAGJ33_07550 [Pseudomonadota bacterium]
MAKLRRASLSSEQNEKIVNHCVVKPINAESMILEVPHYNARHGGDKKIYVNRLIYRGVPTAKQVESMEPIASRYGLVAKVFEWLSHVANESGATADNYFNNLAPFFRHCDIQGIEAQISRNCVESYGNELRQQNLTSELSSGTLRLRITSLSLFLTWLGEESLIELMPSISQTNTKCRKAASYSDDEQVGVVRDLFRVFNTLASRLKTGTPTDCPFDQPSRGWDSSTSNKSAWYNKLSISAYYLTASFVGDNTTPLMKIKLEDVVGREYRFDKATNLYRLKTTKGRQDDQENLWDLGFTKRGRDFFEAYLKCVELWNLNDDAYLFPAFLHGSYIGPISQPLISNFFRWFEPRCPHGIKPVVSRFRQSKSDGLMSDTNSIAMVSEGLNNLKSTVEKSYLNGNPQENKNRIGSAAEAIVLTAKGATIAESKDSMEKKYGKPLRVVDITNQGEPEPYKTKVGSRCKNPFSEKAEKLKRQLVKNGLVAEHESVACFKFLDCFECDDMALVAEVDDVWCMLSFRESLVEAMQRPSVNQLPNDKVSSVLYKIDLMLGDIKADYPKIYRDAEDKFDEEAHPIWDDEDAIFDLYTVW